VSARRTPVSVRRTDDFDADLEVLQRGGLSASDVVRQAVKLVAQAHRTIEQITAAEGEPPQLLSIYVTSLTRPYDASAERHTGGARVIRGGGSR
jgi:Arc/MetJ-type ribon-helix-helix transcriptional regulator